METDDATNEATLASTDVNMQDAKAMENGVLESGEEAAPEAVEKPVQMDTDTKVSYQ